MTKHRRLIHYSPRILTEVRSAEQQKENRLKPQGLWVSVEGERDWKEWCEAEEFWLERLRYAHEIVLAESASILRIQSAHRLDLFTEEFGRENTAVPGFRNFYIAWDEVASRFQGIIIAPYIHARRMSEHTFWYYPWDCASGCIWDASAIAEIRGGTQPRGPERWC